jgi:DNA-binding transcriptional LysR family regulator
MHVTLRQLAAALAVARHQSFRRAAEDVHLSQPALSLAVADLERQLGIVLFDRTSRSVRTTAVGASFLAEAGRLVNDFDALLRGVRDAVQSHRGRVVVACIASAAARLMPAAMRACSACHPGIDLEIRDDVTARVADMVRSGETDFGVTARLDEQPVELDFETLMEDPFFLAVPADHAIAGRTEARWSDLSDETFIAFATTSGIHVTIDDEMRRGGIRPRRTIAVSQLAVVHGMLEGRHRCQRPAAPRTPCGGPSRRRSAAAGRPGDGTLGRHRAAARPFALARRARLRGGAARRCTGLGCPSTLTLHACEEAGPDSRRDGRTRRYTDPRKPAWRAFKRPF